MSTLYELFKVASDTFINNYAIISCDEGNHIELMTYKSLATEIERVSKCLEEEDLTRLHNWPRPTHTQMNGAVIIGLYMEQTVCFPALVLGILKQSFAFLCLNLSTTEEEFLDVYERLNLARIITIKNQRESRLVALDQRGTLGKEIDINGIAIEIWHMPASIRSHGSSISYECFTLPESLAYVVMTSGTCGRPKVVRVPHKCIVPNIQSLRTILNVGSDDIIFLAAPLSFDPSVVELFLALSSGSAILIVANVTKTSPNLLLEALFPEPPRLYAGTTILQITPSVLSRWSDETIRNVLFGPMSSLRALVLGGEPCPNLASLQRWKTPASRTEIYNIYGITEVSCWASLHKVDICDQSMATIPLGSALSETILQVRNDAGEIIDDGEGEVFIGSCSRVCQIDSEAEDSNFSSPLFRETGDIVKVNKKNNAMFFVSRRNSVIKRWGHRVNLFKIEKTARQHDAVGNCGCVWDQATNTLCLFVQPWASAEQMADVRRHLANRLRPSAVPDLVLAKPRLPLTSHGKLDRQTLLQTLRREVETRARTLSPSVTAAFQELWSRCLGRVRPGDSFSGLGGTSIEAVRLATELKAVGHRVPALLVVRLLTGATFEECCQCLEPDTCPEVPRKADSRADAPLGRPCLKPDTCPKVPREANSRADGPLGRPRLEPDKCPEVPRKADSRADAPLGRLHLEPDTCPEVPLKAESRANAPLGSLRLEPDTCPEVPRKAESRANAPLGRPRLEPDTCPEIPRKADSRAKAPLRRPRLELDTCPEVPHKADSRADTPLGRLRLGPVTCPKVPRKADSRADAPLGRPPDKRVRPNKECATGLIMSSCRGRTFEYPELKEVTRSISVSCASRLCLTIGWKFDLGKCVDASPLCVNYRGGWDKVVVGSHSHSMAIIDTHTGELTSVVCQLPDRIESSACVSLCGKYAFVGCYDGLVYCLNLETSVIEWRYETKGMVKCSPVLCLDGGAIVVGSYDKALYCLRVTDGSLVWSTTPGSGGVFSSPCMSPRLHLHPRAVYVATLDGTVSALSELTGGTIWTKTLGGPIFSSPALLHNGCHVLFAEVAGLVSALCSRTGQLVWTFQADGNIFSSFCITSSKNNIQFILFGCHDKHLYCLEASSTQVHLVWKSKMDSAVFATPFVISIEQGLECQESTDEFVGDDLSLVVVASVQGCVRLVSLCDGKERCCLSLPQEVFSSPVVSGNQIIVGCRDNNVYSLNVLPMPVVDKCGKS